MDYLGGKIEIMDKKINNISFIKTIMMLIIVLYHSMLFFGDQWFEYETPIYNANYLYNIALWLSTFHVQTFAMSSGFLFYYLRIEKDKYNNPKNDILKRAKRLLIPYFFTSLLWAIPITTYYFNYSFKDIIINFLFMKNPNQLWFLIMLFLTFVFFEFFGNKIKISFKNLIIIYVLSTGIGLVMGHIGVNYFQLALSIQYILYFYLGGFIYKYKDKITLKQTILMIIGAAILYVITLFVNSLNIKVMNYAMYLIKPLISIFEVTSIYYVCAKIVDNKTINNKIYKIFEDNSFGIYLFHQQIIYFTIVFLNGFVHPIIQVLISFIVALSISLLMSILLKKNKVTKLMFGL